MTDPYPAYIRDNPIMQIAFRDFMTWIWGQEGAHEAFQKDTGTPALAKGFSARIDEATGLTAHYAAEFTKWAIDNQWGVEGRDEIEPQPVSKGAGSAEQASPSNQ